MSLNTDIEWTDATWSPLRVRVREDAAEIARQKGYASLIQIGEEMAGRVGQHCEHVSEGCKHCYSGTWQARCLKVNGTGLPFDRRSRDLIQPFVDEKALLEPLKWRNPKLIFVENQSDLFGEWWTNWQIDLVFAAVGMCDGVTPWERFKKRAYGPHTLQVLTKRPERMLAYCLSRDATWGLDHFVDMPDFSLAADWVVRGIRRAWLGVSIEDQATADERIPLLLQTPAAKRFVSYEPALGPVDFRPWLTSEGECIYVDGRPDRGLDWVIAGGESGPGARPPHPDWFRSVRYQCVAAGVPFFFKQWGAFQWGSTEFGASSRDYVVLNDGRFCRESELEKFQQQNPDARERWSEFRPECMGRVGKKKADALLDGREWREFPEAVHAS